MFVEVEINDKPYVLQGERHVDRFKFEVKNRIYF